MSELNLTREELYKQVWLESMTSLAKKYEVKYEVLRKICKSQNIPVPKSGHWMRRKYGKHVEAEPLPLIQLDSKENGIEQPVIIAIEKEPSPLESLQMEIENDTNISLVVPSKLLNPDILITQTKDTILNPGDYKTGYKSPSGFSRWEVLRIDVRKDNLGRALRFMDTLIKALKGRNHEIKISGRGTCVIIYGEEVRVNCREKNKRIIVQGKYGSTSELVPTGILTFNMEGIYPKEWKDGKQQLEEQLSKIIAKLEFEGKRKKEQTEYARRHNAEQAEIRRIELEQRQLVEKERQNFESLLQSALKYREAILLREYIDVIENKMASSGELDEKLKQWIKWARKRAESHDPLSDIHELVREQIIIEV